MLSRLKSLFPYCDAYNEIRLVRPPPVMLTTNTPYREQILTLIITTKLYGGIFLQIDALPGQLTRFVEDVLRGQNTEVYAGMRSATTGGEFFYSPHTGLWFEEERSDPIALPLCWKIFAALLEADALLQDVYRPIDYGW